MTTQLEIHPAIGIARVGTSNKHFIFSGPESAKTPRRDGDGRLLRQAAEFRIYRVERDAQGGVTSSTEITTANATIQWTAHLANRKAAAMEFSGKRRRNDSTGNDEIDRPLIIDSGPQSVSNANESKALVGAFKGETVALGRMTMATNGRLVMVGGDGTARSPGNRDMINFADNDDWFDTVSDGAIRARITLPGAAPVDALPAWLIVAPPDYAPGVTNLVTLYDVLVDTAIEHGVRSGPQTIVFSRHIRPILERAMGYQWVNRAAQRGHSSRGPGDFSSLMKTLGDPAGPKAGRVRIFRLLRDPDSQPHGPNRGGMPRLNDDTDKDDVFTLTRAQYSAMLRWSQGDFVADAAPEPESEPEALTRMALEACAGGPFFPGIEAGRIMSDTSRYMAGQAFRLAPDAVKPGEITQNNAVPWQADFHLCRWEGTDEANSKQLGWWPAQRPDDVLLSKNARPRPWARGIPDTFDGMTEHWHRLGFVKEDPANPGSFIEQERDPSLPDEVGIV